MKIYIILYTRKKKLNMLEGLKSMYIFTIYIYIYIYDHIIVYIYHFLYPYIHKQNAPYVVYYIFR